MVKYEMRIFLLIVSIIFGCKQNSEFGQLEEMSLKGIEVKINANLNPTRIYAFDSILIVKEPKLARKVIKLIDLNNLEVISSSVWLGKGPGELANPSSLVFDQNNWVVWFSDWGKLKCFKFPIDSLVLNPDFKPTESFSIRTSLMPMMNMFYHPSGNFGFSSFNLQNNLVAFINNQGELIDSLAIPNKIYPDIWEDAGPSDNAIILHYNLYHEKYVVASRFKNNIAVIDEQGNPVFQVKGAPVDSKPSFRTFYQVDSDEEYIFCLYKGGVIQGYDTELQRGVAYYPYRVLVFDWQGVGRYDIYLDYPLKSFALDEENRRIIGSTESFENGLVMYDLFELQ